ncbi:MAG: hypothetical protein OEL88_04120 [Sterolibacteriaceae bacterium MAG5]|nr:hypothetical protein [Candidatus Nitricoxidireducens bremensis]
MSTHEYSFLILTLVAGLDLLAAVMTSIPDGIVGGVLVACLALMMVLETSAARSIAAPAGEAPAGEAPDLGRASHD